MNIAILGGNGFIGSHLAKRLREEGNWVRVVDIKRNEYMQSIEFSDENIIGDLRDAVFVQQILSIQGDFDEVYQLAADMGGAGYIFTGENDANIMHSSSLINLNVAHEAVKKKAKRLFYSSSACMYPSNRQEDVDGTDCCQEHYAYPANPDSEYGWEKLFSERLYKAFERNYGLQVRIARFHNIFGPQGTWRGGKEKAPAAICRKIVEAPDRVWPIEFDGTPMVGQEQYYPKIDIWGDGQQMRSFLYIDECVEGIIRLMRSDCTKILNIGSDEMISINDLARMVIKISGKNLTINNIPGPTGVRGRNSHNDLIYKELGWRPDYPLEKGMRQLYSWIEQQIHETGS